MILSLFNLNALIFLVFSLPTQAMFSLKFSKCAKKLTPEICISRQEALNLTSEALFERVKIKTPHDSKKYLPNSSQYWGQIIEQIKNAPDSFGNIVLDIEICENFLQCQGNTDACKAMRLYGFDQEEFYLVTLQKKGIRPKRMLVPKKNITGRELFELFALYRSPLLPEIFLNNISKLVKNKDFSKAWDSIALQLRSLPDDAYDIVIRFGDQSLESMLPNYREGELGWKDWPLCLDFSRRQVNE